MFDACIEVFRYDDATIFLNEYEKKMEFKKKDGEFLIINQRGKKLASVDSERIFTSTLFRFLKGDRADLHEWS